MKFRVCSVIICVNLACAEAPAQGVDPEASRSHEFELPGSNAVSLIGDVGLDLDGIDFSGNPNGKWFRKWPEDLVIAPIPGRSPQIGWNLTMAGGYFLQSRDKNSTSPPSILGGFAMFAENGSYAYGAGANLHLLDDRLRVKAGAGYVDVRYRFYGIGDAANDKGISIYLLQEAPLYFGEASWRVWKKLYVGLGYLAGDVDTRLRFVLQESLAFDPTLSVNIAAVALPLEWDSRDHEQFPRRGWLSKGQIKFYRKSVGSDFDAEIYKLEVNHYRPMRDRDALAFRAYLRSTVGDAPFFLLSTFGGSKDLRGYPSGRYRDRKMYALQSEYRWQFNDSWIFTGFAGFGEVAEKFQDFGKNFLPAAGVGARYLLSKKHRVGLSFDAAVGDDGAEYYFGIGEAF